MDVFGDAWAGQINDLSVLVKDINDICQGKSERQVYMSLPRPGVRHTKFFFLLEGLIYVWFCPTFHIILPCCVRTVSMYDSVLLVAFLVGHVTGYI